MIKRRGSVHYYQFPNEREREGQREGGGEKGRDKKEARESYASLLNPHQRTCAYNED